MGHYIKVTELPPAIQKGLKAVGYHRKDIEVTVQESILLRPPSAKGCRGFCVACNLNESTTPTHKVTWGSWGGSNMFTRSVDDVQESIPIPKDVAFIKGMSGGGRPTYATLTVAPTNVNPKLLPSNADVSEREEKILAIFARLKSFARPEYLERMNAKPEEVDSLVERGFLKRNKVGATRITTEGRNAAGREYY